MVAPHGLLWCRKDDGTRKLSRYNLVVGSFKTSSTTSLSLSLSLSLFSLFHYVFKTLALFFSESESTRSLNMVYGYFLKDEQQEGQVKAPNYILYSARLFRTSLVKHSCFFSRFYSSVEISRLLGGGEDSNNGLNERDMI